VKLIVAGSREYRNFAGLMRLMVDSGFDKEAKVIVSGCCRGVDLLGERYAEMFGLGLARYPANWNRYGRAAGPKRNEQMARFADALLAIKPRNRRSPGTEDMIRRAEAHGLRLFIFEYGGDEAPEKAPGSPRIDADEGA
jgi:hypothetical protein